MAAAPVDPTGAELVVAEESRSIKAGDGKPLSHGRKLSTQSGFHCVDCSSTGLLRVGGRTVNSVHVGIEVEIALTD